MKREDQNRMGELRVEVGVKERFKKKLVRSRLKWVGHAERMIDEKLAKSAESGRKRKWREKGGDENGECDRKIALRYQARVGGEWRTTTKGRRSWGLLTENVEKSEARKEMTKQDESHQGQPHPCRPGQQEENTNNRNIRPRHLRMTSVNWFNNNMSTG